MPIMLPFIFAFAFALEAAAFSAPTQLPEWSEVSDADLSTFSDAVGGATLVGLGESVHATEGFSQAKLRLIRYLVEQKGFRNIAMETPWRGARGTANYIDGGDTTLLQAVAGVFSVWNSQSVSELFAWLRKFNQAHPKDPVRFFGFDIQYQTPVDVADLRTFLGSQFPEALSVCLNTATQVRAIISSPTALVTEKDHQDCLNALDNLNRILSQLPESEALAWARIQAVDIQSFEDQLYYWNRNSVESENARDNGMAQVLMSMLATQPANSKTVVWAHNVHLAENSVELGGPMFKGVSSMGSHLSRTFGANYAPFALTGYHVSVNWPGVPVQDMPMPSDNSMEALLRSSVAINAFVDLRGNSVPTDQMVDLGWNLMNPSRQFRGLFYMTEVPAMVNPVGY